MVVKGSWKMLCILVLFNEIVFRVQNKIKSFNYNSIQTLIQKTDEINFLDDEEIILYLELYFKKIYKEKIENLKLIEKEISEDKKICKMEIEFILKNQKQNKEVTFINKESKIINNQHKIPVLTICSIASISIVAGYIYLKKRKFKER